MKRFFTLVTILASSVSVFAFSNRLSVSTAAESERLSIVIDGRNYALKNRAANDIIIDDLRAGYHTIKVYQAGKSRGWNGNNRNGNSSMKLLYSGNVNIRNGYHTDILINRFGRAFVDERSIGRKEEDYNGYDDYDNNWSNQAMSERSFEQLKQTIRRESFDDTRLTIAKTAIRNQQVSTAQVRDLLGLISFEQNKLDIAKYCYQYTVDYNNYYLVANSFAYNNSKQELLRYIEQYRRP